MGISFQVSHPHVDLTCYPPPSLRRMELRTGTNKERCLNNLALWGCCHVCSILVPFDFAQGHELVEGPFHNLRTNGGGFEKRPPYPFLGFKRGTLNLTHDGRYVKITTYTSKKVEFNLFWTALA